MQMLLIQRDILCSLTFKQAIVYIAYLLKKEPFQQMVHQSFSITSGIFHKNSCIIHLSANQVGLYLGNSKSKFRKISSWTSEHKIWDLFHNKSISSQLQTTIDSYYSSYILRLLCLFDPSGVFSNSNRIAFTLHFI